MSLLLADPPALPGCGDPVANTRRGRLAPWRSPPGQPSWARPALLGIAAVAALLYAWNIADAGLSPFYSVAVKSMSESWKAFFYGAFDPKATITIDKLAGSFLPQALSARIFGFHPWSLALPQVVEGVVTVLVMYRVVRRWAGVVPGLLAAGIMAITPIAASMFGHSMEDGALIMCLVLAADAYQRAVLEARLRSLVWAGIWVGVGFQAKMLEAWMILPALVIGYLATAPPRLGRRLWHLCVAGTVMLAVSLSWIALYTVTPASDRPYVDGSTNNSAVAMVFGYNGIERFGVSVPGAVASMFGGGGGRGRDIVFGGGHATVGGNQASSARPGQPATPPAGLPAGGQVQPGGQGGPAPGGLPGGLARTPRMALGGFAAVLGGGWTKLFGSRFGPEVGWLVPLALLALVLGLGWRRRAPRTDPVRGGLVMWGVWLLTFGVIYSEMSVIPHTAYVAALAPPIAALSAAGIVTFWRLYRSGDRRGWVLPLAVAAELAWAAYLWRSYRGFLPWALWVAIVAGGAAIAVMVMARLSKRTRGRLVMAGLVAGVAAMLAAPAAWASSVLDARYAGSSLDAGAGPAGGMGGGLGSGVAGGRSLAALAALAERYGITLPDSGRFRAPSGTAGPGGLLGTSTALTAAQQRVYDYVSAHRGGAGYLMAVQSWSSAAPYILTTGQEVLAMGGFSGSVPEPTLTHVRQLVSSGQLRFFMLGGSGFGLGMARGGGSDAQAIASWVETSCTKVPANDYRARSGTAPIASAGSAGAPASFGGADGGSGTLYECGKSS